MLVISDWYGNMGNVIQDVLQVRWQDYYRLMHSLNRMFMELWCIDHKQLTCASCILEQMNAYEHLLVVMLQVLVTTFWSQIEWISSSFCTILVQGDISCWFSGFMFIVRLFLQVIQFSNLRLTYCYSISTVLVYDRVEGLRLRLVPHAYVCYLTCHICSSSSRSTNQQGML